MLRSGTIWLLLVGLCVSLSWGASTSGVFKEMLSFIPDTPESRREVYINKYYAAARAIGLAPPLPFAGEAIDYLLQINKYGALPAGPYVSGYAFWSPEELNARLLETAGYDLRTVSASISAGEPPSLYSAIVLDEAIDLNSIYAALQAHEDWPSPAELTHDENRILAWGEDYATDFATRLQPPVYDDLGRGARLAFVGQVLCYTVWTDGVLAMVDAAQSGAASLADVKAFRLMAEGLETLGVFGAYLTDDTFGQSANALMASLGVDPDAVERVCAEAMLHPFCAFAVGIGRDESGAFMGLVLVHQSESQAEENGERFHQRLREGTSAASGKAWSKLFSPERLEIEVRDRALLARVPIDPESAWLRWVLLRDPLLLHEDVGPCPEE